MVTTHPKEYDKVTFNIPTDLKNRVVALKEQMNVSLSTIYNEAIESYLKQRELQKWQKGAIKALEDKEYLEFSKELASDGGDIYEY